MEVAIGAIAFLLLYCYLIYPGAARTWAALFGRPVRRSADYAPRLTVVVPAHNEEEHIERKIRSILDSDYPREKLKAVVVSDGSSDKTAEIARRFSDRDVVVIELKTRMGKPEAMNRALAEADGEAVVFTDASALLRRGALRALVSNLADAEVGCASAVLVPPEGAGVEGSMGLYRRYENFLRRCESRIHSSLGATGALFAVRRELVGPLRADTILDDLAIPLEVIRRGHRVVMEPRAVCVEAESTDGGKEFRRKVRTLAGNYQAFLRAWRLLVPFAGPVWLMALSHKVLRLFSPLLMIGLCGFSIAWAATGGGTAAYALILAEAAVCVLAACGAALPGTPLCHLFTFFLLQAAGVAALFQYLTRGTSVLWARGVVEAEGNG